MGDKGNSRKTCHLSEDSGKEQTSESDHSRKILGIFRKIQVEDKKA